MVPSTQAPYSRLVADTAAHLGAQQKPTARIKRQPDVTVAHQALPQKEKSGASEAVPQRSSQEQAFREHLPAIAASVYRTARITWLALRGLLRGIRSVRPSNYKENCANRPAQQAKRPKKRCNVVNFRRPSRLGSWPSFDLTPSSRQPLRLEYVRQYS